MKYVIALFTLICSTAFVNAQNISENTIGLRLGDNDGLGAEVSYQRAIGQNNRIEADLGWRSSNDVDAFKLTGLYHWVWSLDGNFNWYAGAGGGVVSWSHEKSDSDGTAIFAAGNIGIEYDFAFPLLLSLDIRPELGFDDKYSDDLDLDIALGVRYQF